MSTRSLIAMQIGADKYRTIYCHSDGYLSHNGALLIDHYDTPEKVKELLDIGSISYLAPKLNPDPSKPHGFEFTTRQEGVVVAYGRDRGEKDVEAKEYTLKELDDPDSWAEYIYVFNQENQWTYFKNSCSGEGFRDVESDLDAQYANYGVERPEGYYGFITQEILDELDTEGRITHLDSSPNMEVL